MPATTKKPTLINTYTKKIASISCSLSAKIIKSHNNLLMQAFQIAVKSHQNKTYSGLLQAAGSVRHHHTHKEFFESLSLHVLIHLLLF